MKTYKIIIRPKWAKNRTQYDGSDDKIKFIQFDDMFSIFDIFDMMLTYQSRHSNSTDIYVDEVADNSNI